MSNILWSPDPNSPVSAESYYDVLPCLDLPPFGVFAEAGARFRQGVAHPPLPPVRPWEPPLRLGAHAKRPNCTMSIPWTLLGPWQSPLSSSLDLSSPSTSRGSLAWCMVLVGQPQTKPRVLQIQLNTWCVHRLQDSRNASRFAVNYL